ncbi:MAG: flagellar basal body protein [Proteobacteria bacterium]|nr:flagellar basal body protein [Pseudomonadota bacterium]
MTLPQKILLYSFCIMGFYNISFASQYIKINNHPFPSQDKLDSAGKILVSGMEAQSHRMKIIAQNLANAKLQPKSKEAEPYRRQVIFFNNEFDERSNNILLKVDEIGYDMSSFEEVYIKGHPAADENGIVKMPNVNTAIEIADANEVRSAIEASSIAFELTKLNKQNILDIMK